MTDITGEAMAPQAAEAAGQHYFTAWRWHFYAGLYVIPFLLMLATTGLFMLWISWSAGIGAERMSVPPQAEALPVAQLQAAAEAALPGGHATRYIAPLEAGRVAAFAVETAEGTRGVALNPYDGTVLQVFPWRAGWYDLFNRIHGTLMIGTTGDRMIEAAASLGIILILSGLYMHWPRGRMGWRRALLPRLPARGRGRWKSLHGALGLWIAPVMVLFLLSGLSWSGIWGERMVQAWSTFPAGKFGGAPVSETDIHAGMNHGDAKEVPWGIEQTPMPVSGSLAGWQAIAGEVTIDAVAEVARGLGLDGRFQIGLPSGKGGVWTISHDSMSNDGHDPRADRTIHIDRYSGNILADIRYHDYSAYARAMAWGVAFHEGDLGLWNLILNTVFCLSMMALSLTGLIMWWKRRPARSARLGAPPRNRAVPPFRLGAALVVIAGLAFPMGGATILTALLLDTCLLWLAPALRRMLG